jgi:hypothetical protein
MSMQWPSGKAAVRKTARSVFDSFRKPQAIGSSPIVSPNSEGAARGRALSPEN